ncbi:ABC transporter ATP-binding protein [Microterricola viridarii]|uniref:ATP-binding cassette, subfamily C n=1 Tax=Microterricola viridarii TaxID=412690 RepID=A0A0X8E3H3_9MICO|nr:ABC transporter ATP-binding protein [Microterricola viridarii]AMB58842.1 hypothetical protein AWU67_08140 [Microterricola viridarii]
MAETSAHPLLPIATGREVRAVVGQLLRLHRRRTAAVAALFFVASALGLALPACLGRIVDAVTSDAGPLAAAAWVAGAALGALGAALVSMWGARILTGVVQDALASLRQDVFASAMRLPVGTVDDGESADLLSRVTGDVDAVAEAGGSVVPTFLSATFAIVVSVLALTALNPWLALAGIACAPFYIIGSRAFLRRSRIVFREVRAREAARSQAVLEAVEGRETLTALNEQDQALARVQSRAEESIRVQIEGVRVSNRLFRWINGGEAVGLAAILSTGFVLLASDAISVGMVTTAALVFHRLFDPVGQLIFGLDDIQRATIGLARLVGVISLAPPPTDSEEPVGVPAEQSGIELREVSFSYPTTGRGISAVTLRVEPQTTLACVGASGSGKSTLARLIAGHYAPSSGSLRLDHPRTPPYYISQELHQFRGGVADNMRLAVPDASDEQIVAALLSVGAGWAVPSLALIGAQGTATPLDEGRIQQLAVARALLADPAVVILDEATADVGLHHREAVEDAIVALRQGRTAVVIAHRLHQASTADQIAVFDDGELIQCGTHTELVARGGQYQRLWAAQLGTEQARQSEQADPGQHSQERTP